MAPELLDNMEYKEKIDIWCFGAIFYELLVGFTPFTGKSLGDLVINIMSHSTYRVPKALKLSRNALILLNKWLQFDPKLRPDSQALLSDPFFAEDETCPILNIKCSPEVKDDYNLFQSPSERSEFSPENSFEMSIRSGLIDDDFINDLWDEDDLESSYLQINPSVVKDFHIQKSDDEYLTFSKITCTKNVAQSSFEQESKEISDPMSDQVSKTVAADGRSKSKGQSKLASKSKSYGANEKAKDSLGKVDQ